MNIKSSQNAHACSRFKREFRPAQGSDFIGDDRQEPTTEQGTDVGNFRAKSVLFGVSMEALSSSVDEALSLRDYEDKTGEEPKQSKWRDITKLFQPRIEFEDDGSGNTVLSANTIGDTVDPKQTFILPKKDAVSKVDDEGRVFLRAERDGEERWLPKDAFQEAGQAYYLPTYRSSAVGAGLSGGAKTLLTFGPIPALAAGAPGFAAHKLADKPWSKLALGAGLGATLFAATNAFFDNPLGLGASLLLGASAGVLGVHAGEGQATVRDAAYSGGLASFGSLPFTGDISLGLHSAAAAGLAARAESSSLKTLISTTTGAALGAAHAALTGQPIGLMAVSSAINSAVGTLAGPSVMQASRNISHSGGEILGKVLKKAPDPVLKIAGTLPVAAGMGFLGAAAGLIVPGAGSIGAIFGTIGGAALGHKQTQAKLEDAEQADEPTQP